MNRILTRKLKEGVVVTEKKGNTKIQRGTFTLSGGTVAVSFSDEFATTTDLIVICQSNTANIQYPSSVSVSGFTANGTGSDTGSYIAIGETKL